MEVSGQTSVSHIPLKMSQSIICTKNRVCIWGSWNSFRFIHNTDIWRMCNVFLPNSLIFIIVKIFEFVLHCHLSFGMSLETWNKSIHIPLRTNLIAPCAFLWCLFFHTLHTVIHNYKWRTAWNQSFNFTHLKFIFISRLQILTVFYIICCI